MRTFLPQTMLICQLIRKSPLWRLSSGLCKLMHAEASRTAMMSYLVKKVEDLISFHIYTWDLYQLQFIQTALANSSILVSSIMGRGPSPLQHQSPFQVSEGTVGFTRAPQAQYAKTSSLPLLSWSAPWQLLQFLRLAPGIWKPVNYGGVGEEGKDEDFSLKWLLILEVRGIINKQGDAPGHISLKTKG